MQRSNQHLDASRQMFVHLNKKEIIRFCTYVSYTFIYVLTLSQLYFNDDLREKEIKSQTISFSKKDKKQMEK